MKKIKQPRCFYCNKPSFLGFTHPGCKRKNGIDGYVSIYLYNGLFVKLLQESKYKGAYVVLKTLLSFSQQNVILNVYEWNKLLKPTIISVPLHSQRLKERGFNQSDLIMDNYFQSSDYPRKNVLERIINTDHLANMGNKSKRKSHIRGAFQFIGQSPPKSIMLVDDVITSGSTILECTRTLKENGIQTVLAFSLAKG